jgi:uncharacterized protein with HEPN domain
MGKKKREYIHFIDDITDSIQKIEDYSVNLSRRLEIIGEAVKNIPMEVRAQFPAIAWQKNAGLRDIIAHDYFGIIPKRLWNIVKNDIPSFKIQISEVKSKLNR